MYLIDALIAASREKRDAYTFTNGDVSLTRELSVDGPTYKAYIVGGSQSVPPGVVGDGVPLNPSSPGVFADTIEGALDWLAQQGKHAVLMNDQWNKGYGS